MALDNPDGSTYDPATQEIEPELMVLSASSPPTPEDSSSTRSQYVYQPLKYEDSIRLLRLVPTGEAEPLVCDVVEVRRTEAVYEALSYAWGPPIFSHTIFEKTSQSYIRITENLHFALCCLQPQLFPGSTTFSEPRGRLWGLWIDAVCIDQSNIDERNHQVKSMASIFSRASKVLVWLGPRECGSCFETLKQIASLRKQISRARNESTSDHDDFNFTNDHDRQEMDLAEAEYALRAALRKCNIVNLGNFFATAWFTRAWVLQEFLLANRIDMFMGTEGSISFDTIASALDDLKRHEHLLPRSPSLLNPRRLHNQALFVYADDFLQHFQIVHDMFSARKIRRAHSQDLTTAPPSRTLYQWCRMLVDRQCADERDKVYAALGLAYDDLGIIPNYNLSVKDVLLDLTKKSVAGGDFSVLHDAGRPIAGTTQVVQPTFIPSLRSGLRQHCPKPLGGYDYPRYKAGRSRSTRTQSSKHDSIQVRGVMVDEVFYLDTFADALEDLTLGGGAPFKPHLLAAYNRAASAAKPHSSPTDFPDIHFKLAFWRTINLGFSSNRRYYDKGVDFQFLNLRYRQKIAESIEHRAFLLTKQGFMGLAPEWAQNGDRVVIFDGAETPFLLRQIPTESDEKLWRLIGDCYLEGWMTGTYFGCTIVPGPATDEPTDAKTYPKGITYRATEFRKRPLQTEFFTLC